MSVSTAAPGRRTWHTTATAGDLTGYQPTTVLKADGPASCTAVSASLAAAPTPGHGELLAEPLLRLVALLGGEDALGVARGTAERRALERARSRGVVTWWGADRLAVTVLGMTPWEVWGEAWSAA
ncbi:MAG: hypothetical protein CMH83_05720 [Nocardioides sp.]|nr:hypothetical protein [Nocardioides sp.]